MKITQALLDHLDACADGVAAGYKIGVIGPDVEKDVCVKSLRAAGYDKYADWIEKVTASPKAILFSGGELVERFKYMSDNGFLFFNSYEEAYEHREQKITPIFLQNEKHWFPVVLEEPVNETDVRWTPCDINQISTHCVLQVFNMFSGQHHRFEDVNQARDFRNQIIDRRMSAFRPAILQEIKNVHGDSAWEVSNHKVERSEFKLA